MTEEKKIFNDHTPIFTTFPLASTDKIVEDSKVSIPYEDATDDVKEWVDFKEM